MDGGYRGTLTQSVSRLLYCTFEQDDLIGQSAKLSPHHHHVTDHSTTIATRNHLQSANYYNNDHPLMVHGHPRK